MCQILQSLQMQNQLTEFLRIFSCTKIPLCLLLHRTAQDLTYYFISVDNGRPHFCVVYILRKQEHSLLKHLFCCGSLQLAFVARSGTLSNTCPGLKVSYLINKSLLKALFNLGKTMKIVRCELPHSKFYNQAKFLFV